MWYNGYKSSEMSLVISIQILNEPGCNSLNTRKEINYGQIVGYGIVISQEKKL